MSHGGLWGRRTVKGLIVIAPLCLCWPAVRHLIESRMSLHMLLEFPMLLASGWVATPSVIRRAWGKGSVTALRWLDPQGWVGATATTCVSIFWMLPLALDATLMSPGMATIKYASWWVVGGLLRHSWQRMAPEVLWFFIGNLAWMSATAGMLYLDTPARLCVNYLINDQRHTGVGLVLLSLLLGALAWRQTVTSRVPAVQQDQVGDIDRCSRFS